MKKKILLIGIILLILFVISISTFAWEEVGECRFCGGSLSESIKKPTCTSLGYTQVKCRYCGRPDGAKYDYKSPLGHSFSDVVSKIDEYNHGRKCIRCKTYTEITTHTYDTNHVCICGDKVRDDGDARYAQHWFSQSDSGSNYTCIYCHVELKLSPDCEFSRLPNKAGYVAGDKGIRWMSPGDQVTVQWSYPPYNATGGVMVTKIVFTKYTAHNQAWHDSIPGASDLSDLVITGDDNQGSQPKSVQTASTIANVPVPSGTRYFLSLSLGGNGYGGVKRIAVGGTIVDSYNFTVKHINTTTGATLSQKGPILIDSGYVYNESRLSDAELLSNKLRYLGCTVNGSASGGSSVSGTASGNIDIIFNYEQIVDPTITVKHIDQSTGNTIIQRNDTITYGSNYTASRLNQSSYPAYVFDRSNYGGDTVALTNVTANTEIVFYYNQVGKIWTVGRDNITGNLLYGPLKDENIVINKGGTQKTYTANIIKGYKILGYTVENSTVSALRPTLTPTTAGNRVITVVDVGAQEKLVTFIYEIDNCGITLQVTHKDEVSGALIAGAPTYNIDLNGLINIYRINDPIFINDYLNITMGVGTPTDKAKQALSMIKSYWDATIKTEFQSINLNSAQYTDYINRYANIGGLNISTRTNGQPVDEKGRYTPSIDAAILGLTAAGTTVPVTFYYTKSTVDVKHVDKTTGATIQGPTKIVTPTTVSSLALSGSLAGYRNAGYVLDGVAGSGPLDTQYSVNVSAAGNPNKQLTFYYLDLTPSNPVPGGDAIPVLAIAQSVNGGSQKIGALTAPQWTVDGNAVIRITNTGVHDQLPALGAQAYNVDNAREIQIRFPFDVYFNNKFYESNTWVKVLASGSIAGANDITFKVPSWVVEGVYNNIDVRTISKTAPVSVGGADLGRVNANDLTALPANPNSYIAYTRLSAEIVGKVEDLTVTYLEGDVMWQNSLFGTAKEYKAAELPIGQNANKPAKYNYGMKLGSPFMFSINTKGAKSDKVNIEPKVLHISNTGTIEEVDVYYYITGKTLVKMADQLEAPLTTVLNKQTRLDNTNNILKELVDGKEVYSIYDYSKEREIGKYAKLSLGLGLRLPYSDYLTTMGSIFPGANYADVATRVDALKGASHWYGDYKLPSTALATKKGTAISGTITENSPMFANYKTGYLLVCFKITTENVASDYLSYGASQWQAELYTAGTKQVALPNGVTATIPVAYAEYCPVALYQAGLRLNSDYEVGGTH